MLDFFADIQYASISQLIWLIVNTNSDIYVYFCPQI